MPELQMARASSLTDPKSRFLLALTHDEHALLERIARATLVSVVRSDPTAAALLAQILAPVEIVDGWAAALFPVNRGNHGSQEDSSETRGPERRKAAKEARTDRDRVQPSRFRRP